MTILADIKPRAGMFLGVLAAVCSTPVFAQAPAEPAPAEWNYEGAGKLAYSEADPRFQALGPGLERQSARVVVALGASGKVENCAAATGAPSNPVVPELCAALEQGATFERDPRLELPPAANLAVSAYAFAAYAPQIPVRFAGERAIGAPVHILEQPDGTCRMLGMSLAPGHEAEICAAWKAKGRPGEKTGDPRMGTMVEVMLDRTQPATYALSIGGAISQTGPALSSLGEPAAERTLGPEQGKVAVPIASDDYPSRALREGLAGRVVVWLAFDREGKPHACRPFSSSNSAYLANVTCDLLLRKARFAFARDAPVFDGLRYARAAIYWALP